MIGLIGLLLFVVIVLFCSGSHSDAEQLYYDAEYEVSALVEQAEQTKQAAKVEPKASAPEKEAPPASSTAKDIYESVGSLGGDELTDILKDL